jgi:signal transduction histidine kinase/CheY-like chemotaxis protein
MLAGLYAQTALFARLEWWSDDAQHRLTGAQLAFEHVVVFDVDEESMQRLDAELGAWPYARDVYARVARYLSAQGAEAVAYDILFSEARSGDEAFAAALGPGSVLAAAALPYPLRRPPSYHAQLARLALFHEAAAPQAAALARPWTDLTLPLEKFTPPGGARAGVISGSLDGDGSLRRVHLLHRAYGEILPSLPLAALLPSQLPGALRVEGDGLRLGPRHWQLAADGTVALRFPANARALPVAPFYQLAMAARGDAGVEHVAEMVRGKIVFIGSSSAILGDFAFTPAGQLPGLHLAALTSEMLLAGQVLRPNRLAWDALLVALALALPAWTLRRARSARPREFALSAVGAVLLVAAAGVALHASGQHSRWMFAVHVGIVAQVLVLATWLLALYRERQRLYYEKLAAEQANRMKTAFLNRMTHELRTPLTAIMGFNKINELSDELGREQRMKNSAIIARNCEHLLALVNENLDIAAIEAGQLRIESRPADPTALLEDAEATMRVLAVQKGLRLTLSLPQPLPAAVQIDPLRVRQVLLNLLGNAVKFTQAGAIELEATWDSGRLAVAVRDSGPGIAPQEIARVFEPFERAVGAAVEGSGLGLALTRELVRLMDGTIDVTSEPGQGTCFRVRVAAPQAVAAGRAHEPAAQETAAALSGRVLLAEDNRDLRALLQYQLAELGLECTAVADGFAAVEAARSDEFDVLVLDLEMPRMDGYEAAHVLRARGDARPILALTAHEKGREAERALREGCDRVLGKPCPPGQLRAALAPLLAHRAGRPAVAAGPSRQPPADVITVDTDPEIRDLALRFLEGAREECARLATALQARDLQRVRLTGHMLKGSSMSFGFEELGRLGGMLEHAARNEDVESARGIAARVADYLARVQAR